MNCGTGLTLYDFHFVNLNQQFGKKGRVVIGYGLGLYFIKAMQMVPWTQPSCVNAATHTGCNPQGVQKWINQKLGRGEVL
jgi:hypothetical protein